ncbi:HpcH/HpaI aldolase/citrate lyase family protein [Kaistia terrae]|uniref:HpcH/HpaI aldolase/citrate lyase family protein n=1 Tax=Kaistia terrae TaxID=537017 RepID=A0ABW0PRY9_9HYPH|nr:CoA ester lyase [Kaistia terrae]MCX5577691.1 CoA ester lyase [Kaistia terrae]
MRARRTLLFAPGNRVEVHAKALATGADVVCLDLEDAVPPALKAEARAAAIPFLCEAAGAERALRINSPRNAEGLRDLLAVIEARPAAGVIFLPKVDTADEVRWVEGLLTEAGLDLGIAVLIESVEGLENVASILKASDRIQFAMFGGADLSAELGVAIAHEPLLYARSRVVHAAKRAGVDVFDVPSLSFRDSEVVRAESVAAKALGFTGKGVLHPANVAVVNEVFAPTAEEIATAERIVAAYRASPTGLAVLDGKLVERPVVRAMERILALRDSFQIKN